MQSGFGIVLCNVMQLLGHAALQLPLPSFCADVNAKGGLELLCNFKWSVTSCPSCFRSLGSIGCTLYLWSEEFHPNTLCSCLYTELTSMSMCFFFYGFPWILRPAIKQPENLWLAWLHLRNVLCPGGHHLCPLYCCVFFVFGKSMRVVKQRKRRDYLLHKRLFILVYNL